MEIHQLRYFAKVAELGNFTRAAEACFVSQPSLSQQIIKLEQELGQPLLERLGRTVRLTQAGEILKPRADQILALLDDAKARITDDPAGGRLKVAAIPTVAPYFLPHVLQDFSHECPRAHLEVVEEVTTGALARCHAGEVDLAIVALPVQGEHLHVEPLFSEELLLVMPTGHPLDAHARISLKDLARQPFVLLHDTHCLTRDALSACHRQNFQPIVAAHISQLVTVQELVSLGQGVSLVPQMARQMDTSPTRCYRSLSGEKPTRTIALVWHEHRYQSKLFKRFVEWLRKRCARDTAAEKRENPPMPTSLSRKDVVKKFRVTPGEKFRLKDHDPAWDGDDAVPKEQRKEFAAKILSEDVTALAEAQELLYADNSWSLLVIFQAMDAAGKDGTIKHVMSGVNPQGCQVYSFKQPSSEELDHNFLWRCMRALPERGRIGIFNRSYYEEVLVVKVHPQLLAAQRIPGEGTADKKFWEHRYEDINAFERHLARNGTTIVKFFLNVSREEQKKRFMARINEPEKHWKFAASDVREREHWDEYMKAYEQCLAATSTKEAPWYVIPADRKWVTRALVGVILTETIKGLNLKWPTVTPEQKKAIAEAKKQLEAE